MTFKKILLCAVILLSCVAGTGAQSNSADARIADLIRKLGSSSFVQREGARKELQAIGAPALEALRKASKSSDVETKRRIADLIRLGEEQLLTRHVLAAKEVQVTLKDATLDQAMAEFTRVSGYAIQFQGDRVGIADKKFTLDTGKTSFWQALDRFCDQAGLVEKIDLTAAPAPMYTTVGGKRGKRVIYADNPAPAPSPIILTSRGNEKSAMSYAGAVKSQLRIGRDAQTKDFLLTFVVSAEPRLLNSSVEGRPVFDKALDHEQRKVASLLKGTHEEANPLPPGPANYILPYLETNQIGRRHTQIRLKESDLSTKTLKELAGKLTLQIDLKNETIARVEKILEASGRSVAGANGGTLKIQAIRKVGADIEVQAILENLTANPLGNNIFVGGGRVVIQGNVAVRNIMIGPGGVRVAGGGADGQDVPDLIDARGQKFKVASVNESDINIINNAWSRTVTILYRPNPDQAAPSELVLLGTRRHTVAVPFQFENVPLP